MNKNQLSGADKQIVGTIKETVGKIVGNGKLEIEGKIEKVIGEGQSVLGNLTDKIKDVAQIAKDKINSGKA